MPAQVVEDEEIEYESPRAEMTPKVYLPPKETETEASKAKEPSRAAMPPIGAAAPPSPELYRKSAVPPSDNFIERYGRAWTWDSWARRIEHEALIIAQTMESVMYGIVGGLIVFGLAAIPAIYVDDYRHLLWQPLGAACGMLAGVMRSHRRWKAIFKSHGNLT
ncbi:MAG: hypothetical protein FJ039_01540 [Chloroflexi bacterium]|nr:hypothetical protein [Chloroflexota bacterium]